MPPVAFEARQPPQVGEALATPRIFRVDSVSYVRSVAIRADFAALLRQSHMVASVIAFRASQSARISRPY